MSNNVLIILLLVGAGLVLLALNVFYKLIVLSLVRRHRQRQSNKFRYLRVKMPQLRVGKSTESEITDVIQNMKQNIQYMNQLYKSLYSIQEHTIHEDNRVYKLFGTRYHKNKIRNYLW
ncbi:MAG: hypothetical protein WCG98_04655 [bacterium]